MTAAEQEQLARLAGGFQGVVTHRGVVYISPPWPTLLVVLPDGETEGVQIKWPDERGENNRPHVGQRVRVSPQGEIDILADAALEASAAAVLAIRPASVPACEPPPPVVDAVWTNPPSYVTPPAADATGEK